MRKAVDGYVDGDSNPVTLYDMECGETYYRVEEPRPTHRRREGGAEALGVEVMDGATFEGLWQS